MPPRPIGWGPTYRSGSRPSLTAIGNEIPHRHETTRPARNAFVTLDSRAARVSDDALAPARTRSRPRRLRRRLRRGLGGLGLLRLLLPGPGGIGGPVRLLR